MSPYIAAEYVTPLGAKFADDFLADTEATEGEPELDNDYPLIPWCDTPDAELGARWVDYSDRGPRDVVVSGPITGGWGPGRWQKNRRYAYWRLVEKYGEDRVKPMKQSIGRWSFLIKNLKAE